MIDFKNLDKMIAEKYISVQKHPDLDIYIYNYTQKAQFDQMWNNETLQCRGLILNGKREVVARPFPKFFNLQEILDKGGQIPAEDFVITEKMDGSLGILYMDSDGKYSLATRGSFASDQAIRGTKILREKYPHIFVNTKFFTHLFEIIYPENRIVVDYSGMEDIVLLAVVENETGREFRHEELLDYGYPVVKKYDGIYDFSKLEQRPNAEGYAVFFPSSKQRFKIKFEEYVRLHRLITGVNARRIWDILRSGDNLDELLEKVPDEFFQWVKKTVADLQGQYNAIRAEVGKLFIEISENTTSRKEFAMEAQKYPNLRGYLFMMRDNKPEEIIRAAIWKHLRPKHEVPFKVEI